ncbi:hypothetical protein LTS17_012715 [Exophiala oligosperma]
MSFSVQKAPSPVEAPLDASVAVDKKSTLEIQPAATNTSPVRQKWYQWFSPTDTPEERRLIMKLDGLILVFVFLAYWAKVLDSSATSTAYVSGMKEDLSLYGNQLNYLNTVYMVGFITMQIPLTLVMTRLPINYFLPTADLLWGVFTLAQYKVGGMSSGYIQAGAYATLNGKHGIEGWRWLYIICFACTVPIALFGLLVLPSTPDRCNSKILTAREIQLAQDRMAVEHREPRKAITLLKFKKTLSGWHFWILVGFAFFFSQADGVSSNSGLPLWLKAEGYSVESINTITTVSPAVTIVASLICGILSDAYDAKVWLIAITALLNIFACIVLAVWKVPLGLKFSAFFLSGSADGIAAIIYAWANEICSHDAEERALVISSMNTIGNTFGAWLPLFVWKTVDAPRYLIGYNWTIALDVFMLIMLFVLRHFWAREKRAGLLM